MAKKLFVAMLVMAVVICAGGLLPAAQKDAQAPQPQAENGKTTIAQISTVMFLEIFPRAGGEDEFYIVLNNEDLGAAKAVSEALAQALGVPATAVPMVSGNLVKVTVPAQWRQFPAYLASRVNEVPITLPEPSKEAPVPVDALIDALQNGPDEQVRMSAAIALGQRGDMAAFKALSKAATEEKGWVRRSAIYAMDFFQKQNVEEMQKWRAEFLNNASTAITILNKIQQAQNGKPLGDAELQKQITDLKAAFSNVLEYYSLFASRPGEGGELAGDMKVLEEVIAYANALYPDEPKVSVKKLVDAAYKGISEYLDPFSVVWHKDEYDKFSQNTSGQFVGIGVYIDKDEQGFVIVSPIFGSPAYQAGLQARDRILKVDGEDIKDLDTDALKAKITGEVGTIVKLTIMRAGWDAPHEFDIKRDTIKLPLVLSGMLPGDIGYIRLIQFAQESPQQFQEALDELNKQAPLKGLIIDLRNNPGGTVPATVQIASMFLPQTAADGTPVVVTEFKGRKENLNANETLYTRPAVEIKRQADYPIVMLVNGASASGAELLTGALHDHGRAMVIGQKTFGKGCGQNIFPMLTSKGEIFFKITVFKYYLPNGECIHEKGIMPDVPLPLEELTKEQIGEITGKLTTKVLGDYIDKYWKDNEAIFQKLAVDDAKDPSKYPGFDEFCNSLKTTLDKDTVRRVLHNRVRDEIMRLNPSEKPFAYDLMEDKELQCAIYELYTKMNGNAADVAEYKPFADTVKTLEDEGKKQAEEAAKAEAEKAAAEAANKAKEEGTPVPPAPAPEPSPAPAPQEPEPAPAPAPAEPAPAPAPGAP
jgi:carboxyl-terminal processing protease